MFLLESGADHVSAGQMIEPEIVGGRYGVLGRFPTLIWGTCVGSLPQYRENMADEKW
jgi:hypothetical protein